LWELEINLSLGARSFQSRVKTAETKYFDLGQENIQLYHNLGYGTILIHPTTLTSILFNLHICRQVETTCLSQQTPISAINGFKLNLCVIRLSIFKVTLLEALISLRRKFTGTLSSGSSASGAKQQHYRQPSVGYLYHPVRFLWNSN
jgi:hypothetical protein